MSADVMVVRLTLDALSREVRDLKAKVTQLIRSPLDTSAQKLLIPAAMSIVRISLEKRTGLR